MNSVNRRSVLAGATALTAAALTSSGITMPAHAAAPLNGKQGGFFRFKLGSFEITAISDGIWLRDLDANFVRNAPLADVQKVLADAYAPAGKIPIPFTPLIVNTGSRLVALDTGTGGRLAPTSGSYMDGLAAAGIDPKSVDAVVISHFHPDHINGIRTKDDQLVFPNAEIMVPAPEWAYWMDDARMNNAPEALKGAFGNVRRVFGSIAGKVARFEPGKEVVPGITTIAAHGHTPGHTAFLISSGNRSFMTIVDSTNNADLFVRNPDWQAIFDMDGNMAAENRKKLLDRAAADKIPVAGYHWPFPAVGYVTKDGAGFKLNPVTWGEI